MSHSVVRARHDTKLKFATENSSTMLQSPSFLHHIVLQKSNELTKQKILGKYIIETRYMS